MLSEIITLSFSNDGTVAATDHVYKKRAHELDTAMYRTAASIADPTAPEDSISLSVTEAKATSSFYGTRRVNVTTREGKAVAVPGGSTAVYPLVSKLNFSFPVGATAADIKRQLRRISAFLLTAEAEALCCSLET